MAESSRAFPEALQSCLPARSSGAATRRAAANVALALLEEVVSDGKFNLDLYKLRAEAAAYAEDEEAFIAAIRHITAPLYREPQTARDERLRKDRGTLALDLLRKYLNSDPRRRSDAVNQLVAEVVGQ